MTRFRDEQGFATVEAAFYVPVVVLILLAIVAGGRLVEADADVHAAARDAARAASLRGTTGGATVAAHDAVEGALARRRRSCAEWTAQVETGEFRPGGLVTVNVVCAVPLSDLGLPGVPATRSVHATVSVPIDPLAVRP
ncbi:MAG: TadE/TadG family type IV pilus assembly protein [Acidimicrobiia bacterium]